MVGLTIKALLADAIRKMETRQYNNPYLDAQLLLAHVIGKDRAFVMTHLEYRLSESEAAVYNDLIAKRHAGYPIQYVLKRQEFMGLDLYIREGVLIPRADTENIVEAVISIVREKFNRYDEVKILDIGTGSGAIGCSLAHFLPNSVVDGIDISPLAIDVATINKEKLKLINYRIYKMNIFDDICQDFKGYHVIISNPPYIPSNDIQELQKEVSEYEPRLALDGGINGLDYYDRIIRIFNQLSANEAILAFECGWDQKNTIEAMMSERVPFERIETIKDLSGNDRGLIGFYHIN